MAARKPIDGPSWETCRTRRACRPARSPWPAARRRPTRRRGRGPGRSAARRAATAPSSRCCRSREDADQGGGYPHQQQRGDQGRLAPDAVAEVAEQRRAQRTGEEGDAEGEEGAEHLRGAGCLREEYRTDHQGGGSGIDVEIVELDGGADEAGDCDPGGRGWPVPERRRRRGWRRSWWEGPWQSGHDGVLPCGRMVMASAPMRRRGAQVGRTRSVAQGGWGCAPCAGWYRRHRGRAGRRDWRVTGRGSGCG